MRLGMQCREAKTTKRPARAPDSRAFSAHCRRKCGQPSRASEPGQPQIVNKRKDFITKSFRILRGKGLPRNHLRPEPGLLPFRVSAGLLLSGLRRLFERNGTRKMSDEGPKPQRLHGRKSG